MPCYDFCSRSAYWGMLQNMKSMYVFANTFGITIRLIFVFVQFLLCLDLNQVPSFVSILQLNLKGMLEGETKEGRSPSPSSSKSVVRTVCSLVCQSYYQQQTHFKSSPTHLNLPIASDFITPEEAITVVGSLTDDAGSMVALSFFYWAIRFPRFRHFMRFYVVAATSLIENSNLERAHEVVRCMVRNRGEIGRLKEAVSMIIELRNQGLDPCTQTLNCVVTVATETASIDLARKVFEEMCERGALPDSSTFKVFITSYCRINQISQVDQWLTAMLDKGFVLDNATSTLVLSAFSETGGWTDKAFRLFLKLVRSESYKPNVYTYTAMISGYCEEGKVNRAEMLLTRMREQGLVPNVETYTTLVSGHCKSGNLTRAYELINEMKKDGSPPNMCTYNAVIDGLVKKGRVQEAYKQLDIALRHGLQADEVTYTILVMEQCKRSDLKHALVILSKIIKVGIKCDIHLYTTLISSFSHVKRYERINGNMNSATKMFERMSEHGCVPDSITYGALISGLCKKSKLDEARSYYDAMMDKGLSPCEVTRLTIAYEYCKANVPLTAIKVVDRLEKKLWVHTVNTLIRKLCSEKKVEIAASFLHKLIDKDKHLDQIMFTAFVTACYDSGHYVIVSYIQERISKGIG
ncbi:hypothetical protein L1987_33761 [Smallanthus sonchifolius]|uniref:Uncharacterized protein n=1 Tax=Smallanthus sonchifolius TaxID=185202 RepID=A0ACB9HRZ3_9ASTR|nr:hypothetical protein L1987_33761 [Smallanthus sonchifolius]